MIFPMEFEQSMESCAKLQADLSKLKSQLRPAILRSNLKTKSPADFKLWLREPRSRVLSSEIPTGIYVYVRDAAGVLHVCPDPKAGHGTHLHPQILGYCLPASAAGSLVVGSGSVIERLDNYSGTFMFGPETLPDTLAQAVRQGMIQTSETKLVQWTKHFG